MNRSYAASPQKPKLWVDLLITMLGIAGVLIFFALYETAFPDASVDVTISRAQAKELAEDQLTELGYSVDGYDFALSFSSDSSAAYYLQRTLGIEQYNARLADEKWPLYFREAVKAPEGVKAEDFGTITREDGKKQTTFRSFPLYYWVNDKAAGDTLGQGVNDVWYVIDPANFPPKP